MVGGLVGVALIAAVGLASRAHTPAGGGHTRSISQDILMEYLLLLSVGLAVVVLPVAVYLFIAGREEERPALPARKNWMMALLVSMIVLSVVAVLLLRYLHDHHGAHDNPVSQLAGLAKNGSRTAGAVRFDWGPVIVVSILAGGRPRRSRLVRRRAPAGSLAARPDPWRPSSPSRWSGRSPISAPSPILARQ